jgi:flagellum-specific peptidoglycan hydrolase FlgJ
MLLKDYSIDLNYLEKVLKYAVHIEFAYKIPAHLVLAVSCLESAWGKSRQCLEINNFFNIKARDNEDYQEYLTKEFDRKGNEYTVLAKFKKYKNIEESFKDFAEKITTQKEYLKSFEVLKQTDYILANFKVYLNELGKIYATNKDWSDQVYSIMYRLFNFVRF